MKAIYRKEENKLIKKSQNLPDYTDLMVSFSEIMVSGPDKQLLHKIPRDSEELKRRNLAVVRGSLV